MNPWLAFYLGAALMGAVAMSAILDSTGELGLDGESAKWLFMAAVFWPVLLAYAAVAFASHVRLAWRDRQAERKRRATLSVQASPKSVLTPEDQT